VSSENLNEQSDVITLKELLSFSLTISIVGFFLILAIFLGLVDALKTGYFWCWILFILSICCFNIFLVYYFKNNESRFSKNIARWQFYTLSVCLFFGISWGVAGILFYNFLPDNNQAFILLSFTILLLSHFPFLVQYVKCFYVFALSLILSFASYLVLSNEAANIYTALLLLCYVGLLLVFAKWFKDRERKHIRLQYELIEQNKKVKDANDSKSQFLASASHDLRQPLQALGFYITMLSDFLREPQKKALFDKTLRAYQALEHLLNQLLNISKLNANLVNVIKTDFSIFELFEKLKNDYRLRAMDHGLSIEFITNDYFAYSDVVSVERIMRNLVENALRYTKDGYIKVSCVLENGTLILRVSDTGIGISEKHISKIFDEFYQVENPERDRTKGFGLGLYAVDRLAKLLDTAIIVESVEGKGSTFSIALLVGEKSKVKKIEKPDELLSDTILDDKVVLLVDDDDVVLDSISRLFLSWKCLVLTATSYQNAIDLLIKEEIIPEILIMDYRLPQHKNGVDLVAEICELCKESIPAIILTGDTGEESLTHINQSGLAFLHKPTDPSKLKERVKKLLLSRQ